MAANTNELNSVLQFADSPVSEQKAEIIAKSKLIYYIPYNILFNECYSILITDENSRIISIITPFSEMWEPTKEINIVDSIKCKKNNEKKHSVNDIYDYNDCCKNFPYSVLQFTDAELVLKHIANIYDGGNPGVWLGNALRIDADEDGELIGVYNDKSTGKTYSGWISTHKTGHLPIPRIVKFNQIHDINNTIDVLLYYDNQVNYGYKISYKDNIAYSHRDVKEQIYKRIWHLLHPAGIKCKNT